MKRYKIIHKTDYIFSDWVDLLPHTLRLRPREGHDLRIESSTLDITPSTSLIWHRDVEGNTVATATFRESTRSLSVNSEIVVQQYDQSPLNFLVSEHAVNFPFAYDDLDKPLLAPYLRSPGDINTPLLTKLTSRIFRNEKIQTFTLLDKLNNLIYESISYQKREEEGVQSAEETLWLSCGSCRDLAYLFVIAVRKLGLAARFVSGYIHSGTAATLYGSTHAWAEVFIPGAGWKGFDPTNGSIAGEDHIAVAVARSPESVPPVAGAYEGFATSIMNVVVTVKELP